MNDEIYCIEKILRNELLFPFVLLSVFKLREIYALIILSSSELA